MENICQGHVSSELCGPRQRQQRPLPVPVPVAHTVYVLVDLKTKEGSGLVWINMAWSGLVWSGSVIVRLKRSVRSAQTCTVFVRK